MRLFTFCQSVRGATVSLYSGWHDETDVLFGGCARTLITSDRGLRRAVPARGNPRVKSGSHQGSSRTTNVSSLRLRTSGVAPWTPAKWLASLRESHEFYSWECQQELVPRPRAWVKQTTHSLATGQAIAMVGDQVEVIQVRQRHTYHAGYTPGLEALPTPDFQRLDAAQVEALRGLLDQHVAAPTEAGELAAWRAELQLA